MVRNSRFSRRDFLKLGAPAALAISGLNSRMESLASNHSSFHSLPNLFVLVFDALSAKDMSLYGFQRHTTPNIARFADRATVFHRHYAAGNFTTPGTASLLMGMHPWTHRAINLQGTPIKKLQKHNIFNLLPAEYHKIAYTHNTLTQILLECFHESIDDLSKISDLAAFSNLWTDKFPLNEFHAPVEAELLTLKNNYSTDASLVLSIIDQFQGEIRSSQINKSYRRQFPQGLPNCGKGKSSNSVCFTIETAVDWIDEQFNSLPQPFFGYVHLLPPHAPYRTRQEFIGAFDDGTNPPPKPAHYFSENKGNKNLARLRRKYDEAIAYADSEFGRLIDKLESINALENTCFVITSDHGEINERGISGHNTPVLYEPLLHIPLIISFPHQKTRKDIFYTTSAVDLVPTLLRQAEKQSPSELTGHDLFLNGGEKLPDRDIIVVEAKSNPSLSPLRKATWAIIRDRYKLIYYSGYEGFDEIFELYDLFDDPEELNDLYMIKQGIASDLTHALKLGIETYR